MRLTAQRCSLFAALFIAGAAQAEHVDLTTPGRLEQLQKENPAHYAAVSEAMRVAEEVTCKKQETERLKATFHIDDISCRPILKTTHPAQRNVSVTLGETTYHAIIMVRKPKMQSMPLEKTPERK